MVLEVGESVATPDDYLSDGICEASRFQQSVKIRLTICGPSSTAVSKTATRQSHLSDDAVKSKRRRANTDSRAQ
eukprot:9393959-Lingulodinium_polyedra.AAC.1